MQLGVGLVPRESSLGLGREESGVYRLRVPNELLAEWKSYAATNGDTAPEAIRALMRHLLERPEHKPVSRVPAEVGKRHKVGKGIDRSKKKRIELQLTGSEHAALAALTEERECSIQFWIVSLIRAALTQGVTTGVSELKALGQSNYQLMAIGRNLNQIAHHINSDAAGNLHKLNGLRIEELSRTVKAHRAEVQAVIHACSERWTIEPR